MELLRTTPPALTGLQQRFIGVTTVVVGLTRIWARSRTMWDWDETLFCLSLGDFDVVLHHPHPPGFPLYVTLAKFIRLFVHTDFHALQAIATAAAIAVFPLLVWLALELSFPFRTAFLGSLLFVFLPNVWFYGGTAFSDIPALALLFAACATLLRGRRSRRAYFAGALLLGLAAAIRPQALLVGCAPALVASWYRVREKHASDVVVASAIGLSVLTLAYGGAALGSSSVDGYFAAAKSLREYVRKVDSFLNPNRPPVLSLFGDFFVRAIPGGHVTALIVALALIAVIASFIRRTPRVWMVLAMFLPFNVIGWFMLDTNSISRYSIGYAAMDSLLAAEGIAVLAALLPRVAPLLEAVAMALITARLVWWTVPALRDARSTASPPVAAMRWIRDSVPTSGKLYVHGSMGPWSSYMLGGHDVASIEDPSELPLQPVTAGQWFVTEGATAAGGAHNFVRERGHLFDIARRRYFEVSVAPASGLLRFGSGWYGEESAGRSAWRWMSGHSETLLPPLAGSGRLALGFDLPTELVPRKPVIEIRLNGTVVDRFVCSTPSVNRNWVVPARSDSWNLLVITMDKVINPARENIAPDPRDLGLNLTSYSWGPAGVQ